MKLTFLGAAHEVTGSCTLLTANGRNYLIDCGMEQGRDIYENQPLPMAPGELDGILLTHAHIDHSGRIPLMVKQGYGGPIYATNITARLCDIMLRDSGHIQEFEAEWRNRKAQRSGAAMYEPLYTVQDAINAMGQFQGCNYGEVVQIGPGLKARFTDVGHLLGSASIELWVEEDGKTTKLVFSGDIGNLNQPLLKDPIYLKEADFVVMESTYGDRLHGEKPDYVAELTEILQETFDKGGNLVIPSFAVGRTQEMLYFLRQIKAEGRLKGHNGFKVYVDSPLAVEATSIFDASSEECFDKEAMALVQQGINPIRFPGLVTTTTSDESRAINFNNEPKVILSASGMCDAGRIRHHLKHNLWRPECTVLFVGYQSGGTLGRALVEGAKEVKLFGEPIEVRASIRVLSGISGHADQAGLETWVNSFEPKPKKVFVIHGEDSVTEIFSARLQGLYGLDAQAPYNGAIYDLAEGRWLYEGNKARLQPAAAQGVQARKVSGAYQRLQAACQRLAAVIADNEGGANKDLARFADQIIALCDKWDR